MAFYAALPDQEAKENLVPKGANADDQRIHGLMTYALVKALRSGRSATYAGLAQSVTASMWQWGGAASTPMFDGDLDREPMINAGKERAWRMTESDGGLMVKAGQLDDIGEGAVFAVRYVNAPAAEPPLFYIRVRSALLEQSAVEIIANDRNRPNRIADELDRRGLKQWLSNSRTDTIEATLIERVPSFVLSVARPSLAVGPDANTVSTAIKALSLTSPAEAPLAITWQSPGSSSDVRLELAGKRLWFIPEAEPVVRSGPNQTYSLPLASVNSTSLAAALRTIGKARNLTRLAATYGETHIARQMRTSVAIVKHTPKPDGSCDQFLPENSVPTAATDSNPGRFPGSGLIRIERCDRVYISLTNTGETPIDVTPLYIDSWSRTWRIPGYPGHQTDGLRVQPLQTRVISFQEEAESDGKLTVVGLARIVLVAIEGKPQQIPVSFRSLVADLPDGGQRRLRSEITGFAAVLDAAAFGNGTVRSGPEGSAEAGGIKVIGVETFATPAEYAAASNLN